MKKRKPIAYILIFLLVFSLIPSTRGMAQGPIRLWIKGAYVQGDVDPLIEKNRTLVPLRLISENLGYQVDWKPETQGIIIYMEKDGQMSPDQAQLSLTIGDKKVTFLNPRDVVKRGRTFVEMDVSPKVVHNRTLVPIRFIAEEFGLKVDWDQANRTVVIGEGYQAPKASNSFKEARVTRVVDGDTIEVSLQGKTYPLRLIGVDTPESKHPSKGVEYFGREAAAYTRAQLLGKTVYLENDISERDRYGRLLAYVWLSRPATDSPSQEEIGTRMFNSILVENGFAHASPYPPDIRYQDFLESRVTLARQAGYGLWGQGGASPTASPGQGGGPGQWQETKDPAAAQASGQIIGNKNSMIYHVPGGASYHKVSKKNAVYFDTEAQAQAAGYRRAKR